MLLSTSRLLRFTLAALKSFADDIGTLVSEEGCDVVVDDVAYLVE